jgi:hypothetical protein
MDALLAQHATGWLFVAGCASNQGSFYDRFHAVMLLSVPREVMRQRIATRSTNPFGKRAHERQRILADLSVEPLLRATSTVKIATTIPVTEVVDALGSIARRADTGRAGVSHTLDTCPASRPSCGLDLGPIAAMTARWR